MRTDLGTHERQARRKEMADMTGELFIDEC